MLLHATQFLPSSKTFIKGQLTFGMIPHITQERRVENNIHHTGRMRELQKLQKCSEKLTGPRRAA